MTHIEVSLHLVNRSLRHSGLSEARPLEEGVIRKLAAEGLPVDWIAARIRSVRTVTALDCTLTALEA